MLRTKSWLGTSVAVSALLVGMLVAGCGSDKKSNPVKPPEFATPPASLNGVWVTEIDEGTLYTTIDNGNFEMKVDGALFSKGTCLTSEDNFKLQITHIHSDVVNAQLPMPILTSKWYEKSEIKAALNNITPMSDADFEEIYGEMFKEQIGKYKLESVYLYVKRNGEGYQQFWRP